MQHNTQTIESTNPQAIVERSALTAAVGKVILAVGKRTSIPILANVLIRGTGDGLMITGTDLDIEAAAFVPGAGDVRFSTTISAHVLAKLLREAKTSEFVGLTAIDDENRKDHGEVLLDFEGLTVKVQALPVEDFPQAFPESDAESWSYSLTRGDLRSALDKVAFAISTEETRYYLNGIYWHVAPGETALRLVATDGHRLSMFDIDHPVMKAGMPAIIVPRATVLILARLLKAKDCPDSIAIVSRASRIAFRFGDVEITSKVIDGTFPDYERVMPRHHDKRFTFDRCDMIDRVKEVRVIATERGRAVKMDFGGTGATLTVNNPDAGSATTLVAGTWDGAEALTIGLNSEYVVEALSTFGKGAVIDLAMTESGSPATLTARDDPRHTVVQMPMRI